MSIRQVFFSEVGFLFRVACLGLTLPAFGPQSCFVRAQGRVNPTPTSASKDKTIQVRAVANGDQRQLSRSVSLSSEVSDGAWIKLADMNAAKAYHAMKILVTAPGQAVDLIKGRLRTGSKPNVQRVARLIAALDSNHFAVRRNAHHELQKLA